MSVYTAIQSAFKPTAQSIRALRLLPVLMVLLTPATTVLAAAEQAALQTPGESPISLYSADYSARFSGLKIEAVQRLEEIEPGIYRESLTAKNVLGKIDEQSIFSLTDKQQLRPTEYRYSRSVFGRTKLEVQHFDWQQNILHYQKNDNRKETALKAGQLDMITHRLQLRRDLNAGLTAFSYPVISRGKLKQYDYRVVGEEVLQTAIGPLRTVKVERIVDAASKSQFSAWLASDWDHLIVKLEQKKNGDSHQLELRGAVINNQTVLPLNINDHQKTDGSI